MSAPSRPVEDSNSNNNNDENDVTASTSSEDREETLQSDTDTMTENTSCRPGKTGKKTKTRSQLEREELTEKIINLANKEDHPVDLELAALSSKIKRKLPDPDDQDDLLDKIKDVARAFFQRKRSKNSTVPSTATTTTAAACTVTQQVAPPPPPLQMYPQENIAQQYNNNNVSYLTDGTSGATYMAL